MKNKSVRFITLTAVFLALLIVFQSLSASLGQLVTGSLVNFTLVAACVLAGWKSGLVVALLSPFFAKLFGIGPIYPILPVVALGNAVLVGVYAIIMNIKPLSKKIAWPISVVLAAAVKFALLFVGVVYVVLPLIAAPAPQVAKLSAMFGTTQLITALIGGAVAMVVVPLVQLGLGKNGKN